MQRTSDGRILVVTDASVLINFLKIGRLDLLKQLTVYAFRIPEEVDAEITYPSQRIELDQALQEGWIEKIRITDLEELRAYDQYRRQMDDGEAACLAIAVHRKWVIACDERKKKPVHREARDKLGSRYLLNTPGILMRAIREGLLTVEDADRIKEELARNRFAMKFGSFREFLNDETQPIYGYQPDSCNDIL